MRLNRKRRTKFISNKTTRSVRRAAALARDWGWKFNTLITIRPASLGFEFNESCDGLRKLRTNITEYVKRHSGKTENHGFVWCIENPDECLNLHIVLKMDRSLEGRLRKKIENWTEKLVGPYDPLSIHIREVTRPKGLVDYMLKGAGSLYAQGVGLNAVDQGIVFGKRAGFSQNLGPKRWKEYRSREKPKKEVLQGRKLTQSRPTLEGRG